MRNKAPLIPMSILDFFHRVLAAGLLAVLIGCSLCLLMHCAGKSSDGSRTPRLRAPGARAAPRTAASAQATRQELASHLAQNQAATAQQLEAMRQQIQLHAAGGREEQARALKRFADS
jgi:DNA recombination protein RmuC